MSKPHERHRVVVVGGGFAGLQVVRGLRRAPVEVTLIDRRNFHLFQPLLDKVATGALSRRTRSPRPCAPPSIASATSAS